MTMATKKDRTTRSEAPKAIKGHEEPARIAAHEESPRLRAHTDDDDVVVPAVTADVDETPKFVKYGAAVLLGLAVGVGCYLWINGIPSRPQNPGHQIVLPTAQGNTASAAIPDPFAPNLDVNGTATGVVLRDAALAESVEPLAPGDYSASQATTPSPEYVAAVPVGDKVIYLFAYDSSTIAENPELTAIAQSAVKSGNTLDVKAYTDEHGRDAYNKRLSERRARAVGDYLVAHGVPASKVKVKGMGATHAYADDAHDRRAEVTVLK